MGTHQGSQLRHIQAHEIASLTLKEAGMGFSTDIEKKSLEAHVELCAERYSNLETKLDNLENRMDKIETHIVEIKDKIGGSSSEANKTIITIGTSIFSILLTAVLGILVHLATK